MTYGLKTMLIVGGGIAGLTLAGMLRREAAVIGRMPVLRRNDQLEAGGQLVR